MRQTFVLCVKIGEENFTSSPISMEIEKNTYFPLKSLNFLHNEGGKVVLEFSSQMQNAERFQGKRVELFYFNIAFGKKWLQKMIVYKIIKTDSKIKLECTNLKFLINLSRASFFSLNCRANFGDEACKADVKKLGISGKIQSFLKDKNEILDNNLKIKNPELYSSGKVKIGDRAFIVLGVKDGCIKILNESKVELYAEQEYFLISGCDKTLKCCQEVHKNAVNFQGEPFVFEKFSSSFFQPN
jgi:uncharacterized phage protein (TIGR02218 family)